jgi:hypothetical protein
MIVILNPFCNGRLHLQRVSVYVKQLPRRQLLARLLVKRRPGRLTRPRVPDHGEKGRAAIFPSNCRELLRIAATVYATPKHALRRWLILDFGRLTRRRRRRSRRERLARIFPA